MFAVRWAASLPDRREPTPDRVGTLLKINRASLLLVAEHVEEKLVKSQNDWSTNKETGRDSPYLLQFDYYLPAEC